MRVSAVFRLLATAVVGVLSSLGCATGPKAARQVVSNHGGYITNFGLLAPDTKIDFDVVPRRKQLRDVDLVDLAPSLRALRPHNLDLDGADLTDAAVPQLVQLKTLSSLSLGGTQISRTGVRLLLGALPRLRDVFVNAMVISAEEADELRREFSGVRIVRVIDQGGGVWLPLPGEPLPAGWAHNGPRGGRRNGAAG